MKILTTLALSGLLFTALPALADNNAPIQGSHPQTDVKVCSPGAKFGMTADQKDKLGALRDQFKLATAQKKAELEVAMHQQRELMSKPTVDRSAVLALQSRINALHDELSNARIDMALTASSIFTPEQREMFERHMGGHGGGRYGGHREGGHREGGWSNHKAGAEQRKVG